MAIETVQQPWKEAERYRRLVVSIRGASGSGKSSLAKALVATLGAKASVRIPGDYFLEPANEPLSTYLHRPLRYDWDLLDSVLSAPEGTPVAVPNFDFETFRRVSAAGGKRLIVRPIRILDTIYPYPRANVKILLAIPASTRRARIVERDKLWNTNVIGRWDNLELSRAHLEQRAHVYDLTLSGAEPVERNAARIADLLRGCHDSPA